MPGGDLLEETFSVHHNQTHLEFEDPGEIVDCTRQDLIVNINLKCKASGETVGHTHWRHLWIGTILIFSMFLFFYVCPG